MCGMLLTVAVMFNAPLSSTTIVSHPMFDICSAAAIAHLRKANSDVDASLQCLLIGFNRDPQGMTQELRRQR